MPLNTIEEILLQKDQRGVAALYPHMPKDYATQAARYILDYDGTTIITTGFYILYGGTVETDGPPGAAAIGKALERLGRKVLYVTDKHALAIMQALAEGAEVVEFPITDTESSKEFAKDLLERIRPSLLISIERCSPSADGIYRNMRAMDVSAFTAKIDVLFDMFPHTVGIGDGGNEIGMGLLEKEIGGYPKLPDIPACVKTEKLVISSVSNWGGWGLVAALSKLTGKNLLPSLEEENQRLDKCVELGIVDGFTGEVKPYVDGFPSEEYTQPLAQLHQLLAKEGITPSQ